MYALDDWNQCDDACLELTAGASRFPNGRILRQHRERL